MASQVGVQLEGSGSEYTMTLYTPMPFDPMYAQYVGLQFKEGATVSFDGKGCLKLEDYTQFYHVTMADWDADPMAFEHSHYLVTATWEDGTTCNVTVVLAWLTESNDPNAGIGGMLP